ncbi:hypothetical protein PU634_12000 [Oceanimonas pelagia]|uniref:Capsular biosynthesis protein n=1 Tax=Oceanimonas pelagia TaxID=3028314 RepID=A0AA50Q992_9GAMM|nr:hypothetical protein [Oceanimonas pelagia]WMC09833.1 hypothetical protein PU634_12000 [Oceanimonas pelagia]
MDTQTLSPETSEERLIWHSIRLTYGFYVLGAVYLVAPVLAWSLLLAQCWKLLRRPQPLPGLSALPVAIRWWLGGMLLMLVALVVGHLQQQLGMTQLIKSTIGWAKGWALLAVFPLLGCLNIRPAIVYRACMHVCLHTLLLLPVFVGAWLVGLPQTLYVSPLQAVGGPGPEFFAVSLYEIDPGSGLPRWRLFTPWAPALGFMANIFFVFALQEQSRRWQAIGISASVLMALMSASRLALVAMLSIWIISGVISRLRSPLTPFVAAAGCTVLGLLGHPLLTAAEQFWQSFRSARAGSTRVRETLARIALDRWQAEAFTWGHGVVERGPHLVEFMPIGSHHSWYGLLFVKGLVGALALAGPLLLSLLQLAWWSGVLPLARVGLAMGLLLLMYTFGENLEILAYLIWPALLIIGRAHHGIVYAKSSLLHPS